jgi:hypothetical protein
MDNEYNDPAADERADENNLRRAVEQWRNEVKPSDLRPSTPPNTVSKGERHWAWR